jgi:hypothetical protein
LEARIWAKILTIMGKAAWEPKDTASQATRLEYALLPLHHKLFQTIRIYQGASQTVRALHLLDTSSGIPVGIQAGRKWLLLNDSSEEGEDLDLQPIEADRSRREQIVRDCGLDDLCCGVSSAA